jgi:ribose transport system substrate-binding protein
MSDRKWTLALAALFLIFLYLLSYFGYSYIKIVDIVGKVADTRKVKGIAKHHIVLISQELDNPFWRTIEHAAEDEANNFNMDLEYIGPFRLNPDEQTKLLEKTIASKVDGILVQGLTSDIYRDIINKAMERGIPVITVDTDAANSKRLAYVGTDNIGSGVKLGQVVAKSMLGSNNSSKLHIGVIIGSHEALNQQERLQGFLSVVNKLPGTQVAGVEVSNISRIQAAQSAEKLLKEHPEINVMVGLSALDAAGILQSVKTLNMLDRVKIFGFDDLEETKQAIVKGEIVASIIQKPDEMGREAIKELHTYFEGGTLLNNVFLTNYEVMDSSNVEKDIKP